MILAKKIALSGMLAVALVLITAPSAQFVLAQNKDSTNTSTTPASGGTSTTPAGGSAGCAANTLCNPIKYTNLADLIISVTKNFVLLIGIVSVGFIVLGGGQLVISAGNTEAVEKGKKTITWAIIGLVVALLAFSIVAIVQDLLGVQ